MIDLILRNARVAGQDSLTDLGVSGGRIVAVADGAAAAETIDLAGRLVTPPLVEPHIHLDAVLTVGQPRPNVSGSLFEGIAVWAERVADLSYDDVRTRVSQILRWQLACGVQHVRSHVDVCDPELRALRALVDVREQVRGVIDLQLVAFPQQGILGFDGGRDLMRRAVELGADVVGGIPHFELTREDGVESVMDPWYPLGYGDPLQAAFVLVHLGQMSGDAELRQLIEMITTNSARTLGVPGYGLRVGGPADLVVFEAPSEADALRLVAPRTLVLRGGKVLARATPAQHTVTWDGAEEEVTFLRR